VTVTRSLPRALAPGLTILAVLTFSLAGARQAYG
jgi:hypothetical protein